MDRTGIDVLSPHERDVAGLLADGVADAEIGRRLGPAPAAVAAVVEEFVPWLGVRDRSQVAAWAREIGLRPGAGCGPAGPRDRRLTLALAALAALLLVAGTVAAAGWAR